SIRKAGTVGRAGLLALIYFMVMSTFALVIGLVVGNFIKPGEGITITPGGGDKYAEDAGEAATGLFGFIGSIIPDTLFSALTQGSVLPALLVALLAGFAVQKLEPAQAAKALDAITILQKVVFRVLTMILWLAPIGAFGAMAAVVGESGASAVGELLKLMLGFYLTCIVFIFGILGLVLKLITGVNIFRLLKYLAREFLLIVATSSSESALPNLMAKMSHAGVDRSTVGIVVPTGYSFNLDGTAIYLTMASIFIADAMKMPMSIGEQLGLLAFMIIASKGAAGVTGAGLTTLAGGLASHRPEMVDGVGVIVGIDRFMSEARALTNFAGNAVATLVIGRFTNTVDFGQVEKTLSGNDPFDYSTLSDDPHGAERSAEEVEYAAGGAAGRKSTDD
ncbi:MAG: cation:dicarboxylase symporter family transporter, partial [Propionibacteriales bacterium]|nr:cation:dicarboxylase symporter family transporter [Propionibacteriales bacterium]